MKKSAAGIIFFILTVFFFSLPAFADTPEEVLVYVKISDAQGKLAVPYASVKVSDSDNDGVLTLNDAFYAAHESFYPGKAAAGYSYSMSDYGLGITKLWGDTCGSYGYYLNNTSAINLGEVIKNGDFISGYVYTDSASWSDIYCFFDTNTASAQSGESISLTLSAATFDASWNPVTVPIEGAVISLNGSDTSFVTDSEGKVTLSFQKPGKYIVSASSSSAPKSTSQF